MVPGDNASRDRGLFMLGMRACRLADQQRQMHLYPQLLYAHILTEEEVDRELPLRCLWLVRRASCIWLCLDSTRKLKFDATSYGILMANEGYLAGSRRPHWRPTRLPVHVLRERPGDSGISIRLLSREELSTILKANIVDGLFQGMGMNLRAQAG